MIDKACLTPACSALAAARDSRCRHAGIDHNLPWVNQAIMSTASTIGNIAATAASMGAGAAGAGPLGGLAGSMVAGGIQQVGKMATKVANVVSSAMVGNVPGSFGGEPGARAYGKLMTIDQQFPDGSMRGAENYTFNGISDVNRLMDRMELADKVAFQTEMANHRK